MAVDYKPGLEIATRALQASPFEDLGNTVSAWDSVEWDGHQDQKVANTPAVFDEGGTIHLYPEAMAGGPDMCAFAALRAFGNQQFDRSVENRKVLWETKVGLPELGQIEAVQSRLSDQYKSYKDACLSFKTLMDRYVAANVYNALNRNGVSFVNSHNLDIRQWGATSDYCAQKRFHTITCFIPAYSPCEMDEFGYAFANLAMGLGQIKERSLSDAVKWIIRRVLTSVR